MDGLAWEDKFWPSDLDEDPGLPSKRCRYLPATFRTPECAAANVKWMATRADLRRGEILPGLHRGRACPRIGRATLWSLGKWSIGLPMAGCAGRGGERRQLSAPPLFAAQRDQRRLSTLRCLDLPTLANSAVTDVWIGISPLHSEKLSTTCEIDASEAARPRAATNGD